MSEPQIYRSVRAVGTFKPKFNPRQGKVFADELNVIGTAFWLKDYKVLVTCAHVIQTLLVGPLELAGLLVVGHSGNYRRAVIGAVDLGHDLAVLTLVDDAGTVVAGEELDKEAATGLSLTSKYKPIATKVAYAGFPLGNQLLDKLHSPTYSEGVIGVEKKEQPARKVIQVSGPVVPGFSGSPVVDASSQELVGVISDGPQQSQNIFLAVSWEHVKALAALAAS